MRGPEQGVRRSPVTRRWTAVALAVLVGGALVITEVPTAAAPRSGGPSGAPTPAETRSLWSKQSGKPSNTHEGHRSYLHPKRFASFTLNQRGMAQTLTSAPRESARLARKPLVISLPGPNGRFQRFAVQESPIMEPGLAARHPDIRTYSGRGIDEPAATIRFDLTPLGFHAQVGSPTGWWYIDPYYHRDQSLYVS